MPPAKRVPHEDPRWTERKAAIRQMLTDGKTQEQIRQKLKEDGFSVTKAEMEAQLRFWGFRKRIPKNQTRAVWQYTDHHLSRREKQGKKSLVYHNGNKVASSTIRKERGRYQPDTWTRCKTALYSPKAPEEIEILIRTPSPAPTHLRWAESLPWLRFQKSILPGILSLTSRGRIKNNLGQPQTSVPTNLSSLWMSFRNSSGLAANIASIMPECDESEIANRAQLLMRGPMDQAFNEHVKLILYHLSNNMAEIQIDIEEDGHRWSVIVVLIIRSGITNQPLDLLHETDSTLTSIAENMLKTCIKFRIHCRSADYSSPGSHESNNKIIRWLLASGQTPNLSLTNGGENMSLLQDAARAFDCQLCIDLLNAGADANMTFGEESPPLLALLEDQFMCFSDMTPEEHGVFLVLVRRFLEAGASLNEHPHGTSPSALMLAVCHDLQTADILIQHGARIQYQSCRSSDFIRGGGPAFSSGQSFLGFSVLNAPKSFRHLMELALQQDPSIEAADLVSDDVLCNAASRGFSDIIADCFELSYATVTREALFSALCAASYHGHRETCELLLQYGAPLDSPNGVVNGPSPLHFAALADNHSVVELLCEQGANVNIAFTFRKHHVYRNVNLWVNIVGDLERGGVNWQMPFINALGAAIARVHRKMTLSLSILLRHGAKMPVWAAYHAASSCQQPWLACAALEEGVDLNWRGPDGKTPLQAALAGLRTPTQQEIKSGKRGKLYSREGCLEVINTLVSGGAETVGSELQLLVLLERFDLLELALQRKSFSTSPQSTFKMSVLAAVFLTRSLSYIQQALTHIPSTYDHGALCASVMIAVSSGATHPLQHLLSNYHSTTDTSHLEGIALGLASWYDRVDILEMLLSRVSSSTPALIPIYSERSKNKIEHTPLKEEIDKILGEAFEEKIPFWHQEPQAGLRLVLGSPLTFALWSNDCLNKLLHHNFYPDRLTISVAVRNRAINSLEMLAHLPTVDHGHDNEPGPLYLSVEQGLIEVVRLMLDAEKDPNENNYLVRSGRSPLQKAVEDGNLDMVKLLLEAGADVNAPAAESHGATALQFAAITGRIGIARQLIDLKANVNASGAKEGGRTALEGAAEHGRLDMVHFLLSQNAQVTGNYRLHYFRALSFARDEGHLVVAKLLEDYQSWSDRDHELWVNFRMLSKDDRERMVSINDLEELVGTSDDDSSMSSFSGGERDGLEHQQPLDESPTEPQNHRNTIGVEVETEVSALKEQSFPNEDFETPWEKHLESTNHGSKDPRKAMPLMNEHGGITVEQQTTRASYAEVSWNQQYQTSNRFQSRDSVAAEGESVTCDESHSFDMDWFRSQSSVAVQRETGVCYEILEGDMDWLETQDDGSQMFDMDWSQ